MSCKYCYLLVISRLLILYRSLDCQSFQQVNIVNFYRKMQQFTHSTIFCLLCCEKNNRILIKIP